LVLIKKRVFATMKQKALLTVGSLTLLMLLAGCVSGIGGGSSQNNQASSVGAIIQTDVVPGHEGVPENDSLIKPCVPLGTYARGMQPAWHVTVIDPTTGDKMTNETVDSVTVSLGDGQTVQTEFHSDEKQWHGCVVLPDDAKTGDLQYTVNVDIGDKTYKSSGSIGVVEELKA